MPYEPKEWLTAKEAANYIKTSEATIYNLVKRGQLRAAKVTGKREFRFLREWLDEWLMNSVTIPMVANQ